MNVDFSGVFLTVQNHGCVYTVCTEGELFYAPMYQDGSVNLEEFDFVDFWYNTYHDNQGQEPHTHLTGCMSATPYWCGIYYNKGSTPTTFFRPDSNNRVHQFPHQGPEFKEYFADYLKPGVSDGDVILFPPYLQHCVDLQSSASMRMTFSFNLQLYNEHICHGS